MKINSHVTHLHSTTSDTASCREILVPVDFSSGSISALREAAALAGKNHAHVTVLNVVADQAVYRGQPVPATQTQRELQRGERIQKLVASELPGIENDIVVSSGEPAREICRLAKSWHADLIILGLHSDDEPHPLFAKHHPISRRVTADAPCRVLLTGHAA